MYIYNIFVCIWRERIPFKVLEQQQRKQLRADSFEDVQLLALEPITISPRTYYMTKRLFYLLPLIQYFPYLNTVVVSFNLNLPFILKVWVCCFCYQWTKWGSSFFVICLPLFQLIEEFLYAILCLSFLKNLYTDL